MGFSPQRTFDARFAFSPKKETAYGTALADAKFTRSTTPLGFDLPDITKGFRTDGDKLWKGHEWPTERTQVRQDARYPLNFELSALTAGQILAFLMGDVDTTLKAAGPPAAYEHVILFSDPVADGRQLPSTGHWFKSAAGLECKTKGAVCISASLSHTRGQPICALNSQWVGSGEVGWANLANVPAITAGTVMNFLYEKDLEIKLGVPTSESSIKDRVVSFTIDISNGAKIDEGYYPGSGLYRGLMWQGVRTVVPTLVILAKETDDIRSLFTGDTEQGFRVTWTGETITGAEKAKLDIYIPSIHFTASKIGEQNGEVAWSLTPGAEGVFKATGKEICTLTVQNQETAYLGT